MDQRGRFGTVGTEYHGFVHAFEVDPCRKGSVATLSSPVFSSLQSIWYSSIVFTIPARLSRPRRSSRGMSSGYHSMPLAWPCVSEAEQKPPFRPDAAQPNVIPSRRTTSRAGSSCLASRAVQSPEYPPPMIARSVRTCPVSRSRGGARRHRRATNTSVRRRSTSCGRLWSLTDQREAGVSWPDHPCCTRCGSLRDVSMTVPVLPPQMPADNDASGVGNGIQQQGGNAGHDMTPVVSRGGAEGNLRSRRRRVAVSQLDQAGGSGASQAPTCATKCPAALGKWCTDGHPDAGNDRHGSTSPYWDQRDGSRRFRPCRRC